MHRISLLNYSLHHIQPGVLWERVGVGGSSLQIFHISSLVPVSEAQAALSPAFLSHFGTVS